MSRVPWWFWLLAFVVLLKAPGIYMAAADDAVASLNEISSRYSSSSTTAPWTPPCDVGAVLDVLGLSVVEYQASRGLAVDGVVGPQTAGAACAEVLPLPEGTIP